MCYFCKVECSFGAVIRLFLLLIKLLTYISPKSILLLYQENPYFSTKKATVNPGILYIFILFSLDLWYHIIAVLYSFRTNKKTGFFLLVSSLFCCLILKNVIIYSCVFHFIKINYLKKPFIRF